MLKKHINYTNAFGETVGEDFYFNMNAVEQTRFVAKYVSGEEETLDAYVKKILANKDMKSILALIEDLLLSAYGERSDDGRSFKKSQEIRDNFSYSFAYAELFEMLMTKPESMQNFIEKVMEKTKKKETKE